MFYIIRTYEYNAWKFFYGLLKSKSCPKIHTERGTWQSFRNLNFKNPLESHFSLHKKCSFGRTVIIQSALHFPGLGECFIYSERIHTTHKNFPRASYCKSKSLPKKQTFCLWSSTKFQNILSSCVAFFGVLAKILTSDAGRKFFMRRMHTFWVYKT